MKMLTYVCTMKRFKTNINPNNWSTQKQNRLFIINK